MTRHRGLKLFCLMVVETTLLDQQTHDPTQGIKTLSYLSLHEERPINKPMTRHRGLKHHRQINKVDHYSINKPMTRHRGLKL